MALVVETGSGSSTAESYSSVADTDTYWLNRDDPATWSGASTAVKEAALRIATQYLDAKHNLRWKGTRRLNTQRLAWPRTDITDFDGFSIPSDSLPRALAEATSEAAHRHITETGGLIPDVTSGGIEREKVKVGSLEEDITYAGSKDAQPTFTVIESLLRDLLHSTGFVERS